MTTGAKLLSPNSRFKFYWDLFLVALSIFAAVEIPLNVVLGYPMNDLLVVTDLLIGICFLVDIAINFRTSLHIAGKDITDQKEIGRRYVRGWFIIDLLAALPIEPILFFLFPVSQGFTRMLRLLRVLRVARIPAFLRSVQVRFQGDTTAFRLATFLFWFLLTAHYVACGWLLLDGIPGDKFAPAERYLRSLYWCITTLATVGYGDITPQTPPQIVYTIAVMILGVAIYGYVIGNVTSLLANLNAARVAYQNQLDRINSFMKFHNIPRPLQEKVQAYQHYLWESRRGYDENEVVNLLPAALRTEVTMHMHREIIQKVPIFKGASERILREIVQEFKPRVAAPGEFVFQKGDDGSEMYFISRGTVEVVSGDGATVFATLNEGAFFGEVALLTKQTRNASVRACDFCDLYLLPCSSFDRIVAKFPDWAEQIHAMARQRTGEQNPSPR
jgi:voltage-gated potassium channel